MTANQKIIYFKAQPVAEGTKLKIEFQCRSCQQMLAVDQEFAGRQVRCPRCGSVETVDAPMSKSLGPHEQNNSLGLPQNNASANKDDGIKDDGIKDDGIKDDGIKDDGIFPASMGSDANRVETIWGEGESQNSTNPYSSPGASAAAIPPYPPVQGQSDTAGILGIIFGGVSLFLNTLMAFCCLPTLLLGILLSISGLVCSFFGKPPLRIIGICLNILALLGAAAVISFFVFSIMSDMNEFNGQF